MYTCERYEIIVFVTYVAFLHKVVMVGNVAQDSWMYRHGTLHRLSPCVREAVSLLMGTRRTWCEILDL